MAEFSQGERWQFVIRTVVTFIVLIASLFVILRGGYNDAIIKWAIGAFGLVVGYWLR
jgi:uncharacterized MnhB-related membrane protein